MRIHITEKNGDIRNIMEGDKYHFFRSDGSFVSQVRRTINNSLDEGCDIIITKDNNLKSMVLIRK